MCPQPSRCSLTVKWSGSVRHERATRPSIRWQKHGLPPRHRPAAGAAARLQCRTATILARLMSSQPQAANARRPDTENYPLGASDPDFLADFNAYALLRGIGGDWRVEDVRETIRLGLIGAGMTPTDAFGMVTRYVDDIARSPLVDNVGIAAAILHHALTAPEGERPGKP